MPVIRPLQNGEVTAPKLASGAAVSNIGFTPLQQGGGTSQLTNKVYIGWDGGSLRAQVDTTDFGVKWPVESRNGAQVWVNFNGTGTVAIRASYNVSSITDNGTGDYTVNFTNALADANYAVSRCGTNVGRTEGWAVGVQGQSSSAVRLVAKPPGYGIADMEQMDVIVFR